MYLNLSVLCLLAYLIPAFWGLLVLPDHGIFISFEGRVAIWFSIFATLLGYGLANILKPNFRQETYLTSSQTDKVIGACLIFTGLACLILAYLLVKTFPLLSGGSQRIELTQSIFWNLNVLSMSGVFLYSRATIFTRIARHVKIFLVIYFILILLSAWKGAILLFLILFFIPRYKVVHLKWGVLIVGIISISALFVLQQTMRASGATFAGIQSEIFFYLTWGFANFDLEAVPAVSDCIHTIPIIGCPFGVENSLLINPTWNVFTALAPIYIDGGMVLVSAFFFFAAFFLRYLEKNSGSIVYDYVYLLLFYFFTMAHNGYVFYSNSLFFALFMFIILQALKKLGSGFITRT